MSVPPEALRQLMAKGGGPPGMPPGGPPPGQSPVAGPGAAPIAAPQDAGGQKMSAMPKIEIAMKLMMAALPDLGVMSKEGGLVYKVLQQLQKVFGEQQGEELVPAELAMLQQGMAPPPEMAAMARGSQPQPGAQPGMM
jgi:hypothetical protein